MQNKIVVKCSISGCPRTKKIEWDDTMPKGTAVIELRCPWHDNGDFDQELYFDKNGEQLGLEEDGIWNPKTF